VDTYASLREMAESVLNLTLQQVNLNQKRLIIESLYLTEQLGENLQRRLKLF
jgi:hypothetical protein